jgi:molybdopterin molybdotransferase
VISVEEAIQRIAAAAPPLDSEQVALADAHRRVLARDATARRNQPPDSVSAMDGYAVRIADAERAPVSLRVVGAAPAGHPFAGSLGEGEAVRIFTGGVVPKGADAIAIQEDTETDGDRVTLRAPATPKHIRRAGLDFRKGDVLVAEGRRLTARDLALLAAGDIASPQVRRKPLVAFASTGDELARPGETQRPGGIVASTGYALGAAIADWGGAPVDLGILPDTVDAIGRIPEVARDADAIVTLGGASVGDHDLVQRALAPNGFALDFWKVAMRPGKPLIFGRLNGKPFLGLPGNPVSAYVCVHLFLRPLIAGFLGMTFEQSIRSARLACTLPANDTRQDYLRTRVFHRDGELWTGPFALQDSSMQSALARADGLLIRPPHAPAAQEGERVSVLLFEESPDFGR